MASLHLLLSSFSLTALKNVQSWCLQHTLLSSGCLKEQHIGWNKLVLLKENLGWLSLLLFLWKDGNCIIIHMEDAEAN